jgi:hypothetical protein
VSHTRLVHKSRDVANGLLQLDRGPRCFNFNISGQDVDGAQFEEDTLNISVVVISQDPAERAAKILYLEGTDRLKCQVES